MASVTHLSRRLGRTHNWIVAVKTLMLIHRLLKDGGYAFQDELLRESRAGGRILNLSGFQDGSATCGWEYSAFVRTYALYLDELLDYIGSDPLHSLSTDSVRLSSSSNSSYGRRSGSDAYGSVNEDPGLNWRNVAFRDMKPQELVERMPPVQRMIERAIACHPAGAARMDRLILSAFNEIVRDTFQFYDNVHDGLAILLDVFFKMEDVSCTKAFEVYTMAAKQAESLIAFYDFCKTSLRCSSSVYPFVQKIPEELLETMETHLRDLMKKLPDMKHEKSSMVSDGSQFLTAQQSLVLVESDTPRVPNLEKQLIEANLLEVRNNSVFTEDNERCLILAPTLSLNWQDFVKDGVPKFEQPGLMSARELVPLHRSLTPTSSTRSVTGREAERFMGELQQQALHHQRVPLSLNFNHTDSLMTPDNASSSLLALPAPNTPPEEDPFVASSSIPPPPYVQMSDMQQRQAILVQEQILWNRYDRESMQRRNGSAKSFDSQFDSVFHSSPSVPFL
ncbi:hypothetical protein KP509_26G018700 [Ceratopteris richardii]|nr:hypothetical protein KP509_26G018700 [Ceratopteris richardii]